MANAGGVSDPLKGGELVVDSGVRLRLNRGMDAASPDLHAARWFLPERNHLLLEGDFAALFAAQARTHERYELRVPSPEAAPMFQRLLQAATLWTTSLPNDSVAAWTILLPQKEWRFFFGASASESRVIARWSPTEAEHRALAPRFDCQTLRRGKRPHQSVFEPESSEPRAIIREFLQRSQQTDGRLFWDENSGRAQLLMWLADGDREWFQRIDGATPDGALVEESEFGEKRPILAPQPWRYGCGCDPDRVREALLAAANGKVPALFGAEAEIEVECPRCGRVHRLRRP